MSTVQIFHAVINAEPGGGSFIAECLEIGTVGRGKTSEEALEELQQSTEVYLQEHPGIVKPALVKRFEVHY